MRNLVVLSWVKPVATIVVHCVQKPVLRTTNVLMFLGAVRNLGYLAVVCGQFVRLVIPAKFSKITSVIYVVMPIIPSTYKKNDKRIYINFYTYIGAPS